MIAHEVPRLLLVHIIFRPPSNGMSHLRYFRRHPSPLYQCPKIYGQNRDPSQPSPAKSATCIFEGRSRYHFNSLEWMEDLDPSTGLRRRCVELCQKLWKLESICHEGSQHVDSIKDTAFLWSKLRLSSLRDPLVNFLDSNRSRRQSHSLRRGPKLQHRTPHPPPQSGAK